MTLGHHCLHILRRAGFPDPDIDFGLGIHIIGNLIVLSPQECVLFQIVAWENVVDVARCVIRSRTLISCDSHGHQR